MKVNKQNSQRSKRLLIVIACLLGIFILWLVGYILAINGNVAIYNAGQIENSIYNTFVLLVLLCILVSIMLAIILLVLWIREII